jgi:hypothetical protein
MFEVQDQDWVLPIRAPQGFTGSCSLPATGGLVLYDQSKVPFIWQIKLGVHWTSAVRNTVHPRDQLFSVHIQGRGWTLLRGCMLLA